MTKKLSLSKDRIRILLLEGIHQSAVDRFEEAGYHNVELVKHALPPEELRAALADVHMVGVRSRTQLTAEVLAEAPRLVGIGCFCIGTNQVALDDAAQRGIPVFNAPHSNTRSVAELVIAEAVMLLRGLGDKNTAAHQGRWLKSAKGSHELRGKTLGIIGYGHIGSQVSILAEAFGMRVLFHDVHSKLAMGNAIHVAGLETLLPQADIVTLHVPQDDSTKNLMNAERIALMKPGSCLINASRGTVVDVDALAAAITSGHLAGAAVDVYPVEPKSAGELLDTPLRGLPNVVLTPHIGGSTQEAQRNIGVEVATKLALYSDRGSTIGAVNFPGISLSPNADAHRLLHVHHNRPGVLGHLNNALAACEVNILGQHLQTTPSIGYVVIDVDREHAPDLKARLKAVPGTIRVRILY